MNIAEIIEDLEDLIEECNKYVLDGPLDTERVRRVATQALMWMKHYAGDYIGEKEVAGMNVD